MTKRIPDYELLFRDSPAGTQTKMRVDQAIEAGEAAKVRANLDTVTENIYRRLPSGDYGRGDVKRLIVATLEAAGL